MGPVSTVDPRTVIAVLGSGEVARPRLTHYGDDGRIELSGRVLLNWVSKAMNLLAQEYDARPGSDVVLDLPAGHWRTAYWALAAWGVGAHVVLDPDARGDVRVTTAEGAARARGEDLVVVTLAPLARLSPTPLPAGALDEAAELSGYDDVAAADEDPDAGDPALTAGGDTWAYDDVVPTGGVPGERRLLLEHGDGAATLRTLLAAWAADGSVVLAPAGADLDRIASDEQVTRRPE